MMNTHCFSQPDSHRCGSTTKPNQTSIITTRPSTIHVITTKFQFHTYILILTFLCINLFAIGCGPESTSNSNDRLITETIRVAQDYQATGNMNQARVALDTLDVANVNQWMLYVTEKQITEATGTAATASLVQLSLDMGVRSASIVDYATQQNLQIGAVSVASQPAPNPPVQPPAQPGAGNTGIGTDNAAPNPNTPVAVAQASPTSNPVVVLIPTPTSVASSGAADSPDSNTENTNTENTESSGSEEPSQETTESAESETVSTEDAAESSVTQPVARPNSGMNVRGGPGTGFAVVGSLNTNETAIILGKNPQGDWWQVQLPTGQLGWVYGPLVSTTGNVTSIAVAANIPVLPPTATFIPPTPTFTYAPPTLPPATPTFTYAPPTVTPVPVAPTVTPVPAAPTAPPVPPTAVPTNTPEVVEPSQPHFTLVKKRLWGKQENDGCVGKHLLRIHVLDANGNRLNGVTLKGVYLHEEYVTGSQGKGDGIVEYDLHGSGEDFYVLRDADGSEVTSDRSVGHTTRSRDIDQATLIATGYCSDDASCKAFYDSHGCLGHHSWEAVFQRNY